jgi:hypothetical protein
MVKINVLRPFTFTMRAVGRMPVESHFPKGEHEIDEEMAAHPFISKYFADGCIETPAQTQARVTAPLIEAADADENPQARAWAEFGKAVAALDLG